MKEELERIRQTEWIGREIYHYSVLDSTNTKARELGEQGCSSGTLVIAEKQNAGRGRRGRSWESPSGSGIFMSVLIRPQIEPNHASMLTLVAALAVSQAIRKCTNQTTGIKWPNDIVMNGKKVCGILTEMSAEIGHIHHVIVGIGINVQNESFPEEIAQTATSLYLETGKCLNRAHLIEEVWEQFEHYYENFLQTENLSGLREEYEKHLVNRNRIVRVLDPKEPFEGVAVGITSEGELVVEADGEQRLVSAGEVSVRGIYGYV